MVILAALLHGYTKLIIGHLESQPKRFLILFKSASISKTPEHEKLTPGGPFTMID